MSRATAVNLLGGKTLMMKERLTLAFKEMRNQGLFARQNLPCCCTCSLAEISRRLEKQKLLRNPRLRKVINGYVFFHRQDAAALDAMFRWYAYIQKHPEMTSLPPKRNKLKPQQKDMLAETRLHLRYGNTEEFLAGVSLEPARSTVQVGTLVVDTLRACGIESEWNGKPASTIVVPLMQDHVKTWTRK